MVAMKTFLVVARYQCPRVSEIVNVLLLVWW